MEELLRDVEEDPDMRQEVILHMNPELSPADAAGALAAAADAAKQRASTGTRKLAKEVGQGKTVRSGGEGGG